MKVKIIETGRYLFFEPGTKIRIREYSPIFTEKGAFTFPFNIPVNENRHALKLIDRVDLANEPVYEFPIRIESDVLPFEMGILSVQASNTKFQCALYIEHGMFNNIVQNKKLDELTDIPVTMGGDFDEFIEAANEMTSKNFPEVDFQFPIMHHPEPYENTVINKFFKFANYYKWHEAEPSYSKNNYLDPELPDYPGQVGWPVGKGIINPYNLTSYIPCVFVMSVLKNIIEHCGYKCEGTPLTNTETNQLIFVSNKSIDKTPEIIQDYVVKVGRSSDVVIDTYHAIVFDFKTGGSYQDVYDKYLNTGGTLNGRFNGYYGDDIDRIFQFHYKLILYNHFEDTVTFKLSCNHLLNNFSFSDSYSIEPEETKTIEGELLAYHRGNMPEVEGLSHFGLSFLFDDPDFEITLKQGSTLDIIPISDTLTVLPRNEFNLNECLPPITAKQLLHDLKHIFGIVHCPEGDTMHLYFFKDIFNSLPVADLTAYELVNVQKGSTDKIKSLSYPGGFDSSDFEYISVNTLPYSTVPGQIAFTAASGTWWRNSHDQYYSFFWEFWNKDLNLRRTGCTEGNDIVLVADLPRILMVNHDYTSPDHWMPAIQIADKLVSPLNKEVKAMNYTLAFWRGMQNDGSGSPYPYATPYVYRVGGLIIASRQLRYNGQYGTYDTYMKPLVETLNANNNLKTLWFNMPLRLIKKLNFAKTYISNGMKFMIYMHDYEFLVNEDEIKGSQEMQVISL